MTVNVELADRMEYGETLRYGQHVVSLNTFQKMFAVLTINIIDVEQVKDFTNIGSR